MTGAVESTTADPDLADGSAGFALIDALVALMILSITMGLTLTAVQTARQAAVAAAEAHRAEDLLRYLLDTTPAIVGTLQGRTPTFQWRLDTSVANGPQGTAEIEICGRSAQVRGLGTGRHYRFDTAAICRRAPA